MSLFYHSTRGFSEPVTSKQAILEGIAPDGGLFVSDGVLTPCLDPAQLLANDYDANARLVLGKQLPDFSEQEVAGCVRRACTGTFDSPAVTPVTAVGDDWLLELFHGPTSAFKDVALQMLPQLMGVARQGDGREVMVVTATSGDTGKAALAGFADKPGTGVCVFYPDGGVSDVQRLQMVTQAGDNVAVCAVSGTFDDAQTQVKRAFGDRALAERLAEKGQVLSSANSINVGRLAPQVTYYLDAYLQLVRTGALDDRALAERLAEKGQVLSSANSINVGRLAPQVTYYLDAYLQLVRTGALELGDELDFFVPTGNFGDVLAGYYAKRMGLPVGRLVVCSNANDVLYDFLRTGVYDRRRDFHRTISPSMDILVSSNLERLLYLASDGDVELVSSLMGDLAEKGVYTVPERVMEQVRASFSCGRADDEETRATIGRTWREEGVLLDPHTGVAKAVMDETEPSGHVRVALATASPFKFSRSVLQAIGEDDSSLSDFQCMDVLAERTGLTPPEQLSGLREREVRFTDVIAPEEVPAYVEQACARVFGTAREADAASEVCE